MKKNKYKFEHAKTPKSITNESGATHVDIHINGISHLSFSKDKYRGRQAWYESKNTFKLEIYLEGATMLIEYNSIDKWKAIIEILQEEI